jgi:hypothetical protein
MKYLPTLLLPIFLSACLHQADDPREVATRYWQALQSGDGATARSLVSTGSRQAFDEYLALPDDRKTAIGEVNLGTEQTTVITIVYPEGGAPDDFDTFDTVLVMEDGEWKIDAGRTIVPRPAPTDRELDELADQLSESMQDSVDSLEEAMNEGLRLLDEAMREGSRDMGESMLKGMEEMNRALRESIEEMQRRRELENLKKEGEGEGLI